MQNECLGHRVHNSPHDKVRKIKKKIPTISTDSGLNTKYAYKIGVKHYYTTYTVDTMQQARENHHHIMYNALNCMIIKLLPESLAFSVMMMI